MNKPNIILISIDTLRADHLSCYGYNKTTTPNIDGIAGDGTIYRQNYSTGVWTPPGHASMLTGLYVSEHGVYGERRLADCIPTIATVLHENNYQTAGFVNNSQVGELVGFNKGHELFEEVWKGISYKSIIDRIIRGGARKIKKKLGYMDMGAGKTNNLFNCWINKINKDKPFYAFLHYIEPHNPLSPLRPFAKKFSNKPGNNIDMEKVNKVAYNPLICFIENINLNSEEIQYLKSLYDAEIAYTDSKVGEIVKMLKTNGTYDNTMIIITSDHGEHFGEHGLWSHVASLHKEVLHVPLVIKYPGGIEQPKEINHYTQLVDIFPTVIEISGISEENKNRCSGVNLASNASGNKKYHEFIIAEWEGRIPSYIQAKAKESGRDVDLERIKMGMSMIQNKTYKYVMKSDETEELYDISNGGEKMQDLSTKMDIRNDLRDKLLDKIRNKTDTEESLNYKIDDEIAQNLKSLGYM